MYRKFILGLVFLCVFCTCVAFQVSANIPESYTTIYKNTQYDVSSEGGSDVYYKFVPSKEGIYRIKFNCNATNKYIYVYDVFGNSVYTELVSRSSGQIIRNARFEENEIYYIKLSTFGGSSFSGNITVSFWDDMTAQCPVLEEGTALTYTTVTANTLTMAKFVPEKTGVYFFETLGGFETSIRVTDANGVKLKETYDEAITYWMKGGQPYYIYACRMSATGTFELKATEWEQVAESATEISAGDSYNVNIASAGEVKWFKFTAPRDNYYTFLSNGSCKPRFMVGNEDGTSTYFRSGSSGTSTDNFEQTEHYKMNNTYYYRVGLYDVSKTGSFDVIMHEGGAVMKDNSVYTSVTSGYSVFEFDDDWNGTTTDFTVAADGKITVKMESDNETKEYTGTDTVSFRTTNTWAYGITLKIKTDKGTTVSVKGETAADKEIVLGTTYTNTATDYANPAIYAFTPDQTAVYEIKVSSYTLSDSEEKYPRAEVSLCSDGRAYNDLTNGYILEKGKRYLISVVNSEHVETSNAFKTATFSIEKCSDECMPILPETQSTTTLPAGKYALYSLTLEKEGDFYIESDEFFGYVSAANENDYAYTINEANLYVKSGDKYYVYLYNETSSTKDFIINSRYLPPADNSTVYTSDVADLKSSHVYQNGMDKKWVYTAPEGTKYSAIEFSGFGLSSGDELYIYDNLGKQVKKYTSADKENTVCSEKVIIAGNTFTIRLITNNAGVNYGFEVSSVTSYKGLEPPVADKPSGTIRPTTVTLTASEDSRIYYRISTDWDSGAFERYVSPVEITESCTLSAYAKVGNAVSETVLYNYTIDSNGLVAPTFTVSEATDEYVKISISAPEGTVYYKDLRSSESYKTISSEQVLTVSESTTIAAYAMSGILKSNVVYYTCNISETDDPDEYYSLEKPEITVTDISGGKRVTVKIPDGISLCDTVNSVNYAGDHFSTECGMEGNKHTMNAPWSVESIKSYIDIALGTASATESDSYYDGSVFTFDVYENTCIEATLYYDYNKESGEWHDTTYGDHSTTNADIEDPPLGVTYEGYIARSMDAYAYVSVEKLSKPIISIVDQTVTISAEDGATIFYNINGGEFEQYSVPFVTSENACIRAYAIADGVAQSEIAMYGIETSVESEFAQNPNTGLVPDFEIIITNALGKVVTDAKLIVASFDGDRLESTIIKESITLNKGITKITDISPSVSSNANAKVSVFLWCTDGSIQPLATKKTYQIK